MPYKKMTDVDKVAMALRYPDFHSWRDLDAAMARGGFWENGETVRLSDPEMKPQMDDMMNEFRLDPEKARNFLQNLGLHKPSQT